jgi:hypothetical protein
MKKIFLVCTLVFGSVLLFAKTTGRIVAPANFWKDGYFRQKTVDMSLLDENTIRAKINDKWNSFNLVSFPEKFMIWNIKRRLGTITNIEEGKRPPLAGPHNGIVATYGYKRVDSLFKLNNAVKGMGFLPKKSKIKQMLELLSSTIDNPFEEKLKILKSMYNRAEEIFDKRAQVSLELYSTPEFVTQSFLNQAVNPISTIVFLDFPSYKIKAITRLLDEQDPNLSDYESDIIKYSNLVHSYFHGDFPRQFIAVVYYSVEIFDNSPGSSEGKGKKVVPSWP